MIQKITQAEFEAMYPNEVCNNHVTVTMAPVYAFWLDAHVGHTADETTDNGCSCGVVSRRVP